MNANQAQALRELLENQEVAALGTLHQAEPYVSMVPYALLPNGQGFVIHVSQLAAHTKDMLANPAVSVLVTAPPSPEVPVRALARVTVQGRAEQWADGAPGYAEARRLYLARFPQSAEMFSFADFSVFVIVPRSARFVGGFAQANTLTAEAFADVMSRRR